MQSFKFAIIFALPIFIIIACAVSGDENAIVVKEKFNVKFDIHKNQNDQYRLNFIVEIDSGNYFVSPHSNGKHQRLIFSIENTDSLLLHNALLESPITFEGYDDLSSKRGRFVRETTKYSQELTVNSQNNFEVSGLIWFELRPACQPYEVEFVLSHKSRTLEVSKTHIHTSSYPTFIDLKRLD